MKKILSFLTCLTGLGLSAGPSQAQTSAPIVTLYKLSDTGAQIVSFSSAKIGSKPFGIRVSSSCQTQAQIEQLIGSHISVVFSSFVETTIKNRLSLVDDLNLSCTPGSDSGLPMLETAYRYGKGYYFRLPMPVPTRYLMLPQVCNKLTSTFLVDKRVIEVGVPPPGLIDTATGLLDKTREIALSCEAESIIEPAAELKLVYFESPIAKTAVSDALPNTNCVSTLNQVTDESLAKIWLLISKNRKFVLPFYRVNGCDLRFQKPSKSVDISQQLDQGIPFTSTPTISTLKELTGEWAWAKDLEDKVMNGTLPVFDLHTDQTVRTMQHLQVQAKTNLAAMPIGKLSTEVNLEGNTFYRLKAAPDSEGRTPWSYRIDCLKTAGILGWIPESAAAWRETKWLPSVKSGMEIVPGEQNLPCFVTERECKLAVTDVNLLNQLPALANEQCRTRTDGKKKILRVLLPATVDVKRQPLVLEGFEDYSRVILQGNPATFGSTINWKLPCTPQSLNRHCLNDESRAVLTLKGEVPFELRDIKVVQTVDEDKFTNGILALGASISAVNVSLLNGTTKAYFRSGWLLSDTALRLVNPVVLASDYALRAEHSRVLLYGTESFGFSELNAKEAINLYSSDLYAERITFDVDQSGVTASEGSRIEMRRSSIQRPSRPLTPNLGAAFTFRQAPSTLRFDNANEVKAFTVLAKGLQGEGQKSSVCVDQANPDVPNTIQGTINLIDTPNAPMPCPL